MRYWIFLFLTPAVFATSIWPDKDGPFIYRCSGQSVTNIGTQAYAAEEDPAAQFMSSAKVVFAHMGGDMALLRITFSGYDPAGGFIETIGPMRAVRLTGAQFDDCERKLANALLQSSRPPPGDGLRFPEVGSSNDVFYAFDVQRTPAVAWRHAAFVVPKKVVDSAPGEFGAFLNIDYQSSSNILKKQYHLTCHAIPYEEGDAIVPDVRH